MKLANEKLFNQLLKIKDIGILLYKNELDKNHFYFSIINFNDNKAEESAVTYLKKIGGVIDIKSSFGYTKKNFIIMRNPINLKITDDIKFEFFLTDSLKNYLKEDGNFLNILSMLTDNESNNVYQYISEHSEYNEIFKKRTYSLTERCAAYSMLEEIIKNVKITGKLSDRNQEVLGFFIETFCYTTKKIELNDNINNFFINTAIAKSIKSLNEVVMSDSEDMVGFRLGRFLMYTSYLPKSRQEDVLSENKQLLDTCYSKGIFKKCWKYIAEYGYLIDNYREDLNKQDDELLISDVFIEEKEYSFTEKLNFDKSKALEAGSPLLYAYYDGYLCTGEFKLLLDIIKEKHSIEEVNVFNNDDNKIYTILVRANVPINKNGLMLDFIKILKIAGNSCIEKLLTNESYNLIKESFNKNEVNRLVKVIKA